MSDSATSIPGIDPALEGTLAGLFVASAHAIKREMEICLPATVISYDRNSNLASVQPSVHMVTTQGQLVSRAPVASVSTLSIGNSKFFINYPLNAGDRGWIHANDRDISLYMQAAMAAAPNTNRMHSFSDGFFIPDAVAGFTINDEDTNNMVISSTDGTVRIALWADRVKVTAPNIVADATQTITATAGISITATAPEIDAVATTRIKLTTPLFQVASAVIQFLTQPIIGALNPSD